MTAHDDLRAGRLARVEEHVALENDHDLNGILSTFVEDARFEDTPWSERHEGREGVRGYYASLIAAAPDLHIDIRERHVADEVVVLECMITGTHSGMWRGLLPTGRRFAFPLCAVYTFDGGDRLTGERIYYDRATVFHQLGVLHEPESAPGRIATAITHPVTLAKAAGRQARGLIAARRER